LGTGFLGDSFGTSFLGDVIFFFFWTDDGSSSSFNNILIRSSILNPVHLLILLALHSSINSCNFNLL
jgi:hypothetical protein